MCNVYQVPFVFGALTIGFFLNLDIWYWLQQKISNRNVQESRVLPLEPHLEFNLCSGTATHFAFDGMVKVLVGMQSISLRVRIFLFARTHGRLTNIIVITWAHCHSNNKLNELHEGLVSKRVERATMCCLLLPLSLIYKNGNGIGSTTRDFTVIAFNLIFPITHLWHSFLGIARAHTASN